MTLDEQAKLVAEIQRDEGCRLSAYRDSLNFLTIGYGRLIDERRGGHISPEEALYLLANDIQRVIAQLTPHDWYSAQDPVRQAALINLAYNLGVTGLLGFPKFLLHMGAKEYAEAAAQLTGTLWHKQVGVRADRIIKQIESGAWT